jgi:hypothetical protein
MTDNEAPRKPSRVRVVVKELAILAVGLLVLFLALFVAFDFLASTFGWSMCCQ